MKNLAPGLIVYAIALVLVAWLASGCVTSGDLREVAASLERVEAVVNDPLSTGEDLTTVLRTEAATVDQIAEDVEERTENEIDSLGEVGGVAGLISILAGIGMNMYRNRRGERLAVARKEEIKAELREGL